MELKSILITSVVLGALSSTCVNASSETVNIANINAYMHSDIHIQSVKIRDKYLEKYFDCEFYHVTTTKASGISQHVSFYPDTVAILPNGNTLSVSKPADTDRLVDLEKCIKPKVQTSSFSQIKEIQQALTSLYPYMSGVNNGQQHFIHDHKITIRTANNITNVNRFDIIMANGHPDELYLYYETTNAH